MSRGLRRVAPWAAFWLAGLAFLGWVSGSGAAEEREIVEAGTTASGRVLSVIRGPRGRRSVMVAYEPTAGRSVVAEFGIGKPDPANESLTTGDVVTVHYAWRDPSIARIYDPRKFPQSSQFVVGAAVITVVVCAAYFHLRRVRE